MKSLLKLFKILTPKQMRTCFILMFLMLIGAVFEAVGIGAVYPVIRIIGDPNWISTHPKIADILSKIGLHTHAQVILFSAASLLVFYLLKNAFMLFETRLQVNFSLRNQNDYTQKLFRYYIDKSYLDHVSTNSAVAVRNITTGVYYIFYIMQVQLLMMITEAITCVVIWILLVIMDWVVGIGVAGVLGPLVLLILKGFRKNISRLGSIQKVTTEDYVKWVNQGLGSIKETKVMQEEDYFSGMFNKSYSKYADAARNFLFMEKVPRVFVELAGVGGIVLLIIVKILIGADPASLVSMLGVLALAVVRLMPSVNRMISCFNTIKFNMPLFDAMYDDLMHVKNVKTMEETKQVVKVIEPFPFNNELVINHLNFKYPQAEKDVITDVSFTVPKGSFVGIVGPSGSGKTTLVDMILGLLPPVSGSITSDGKDIYTNIPGWLSNIAYVPQTIYLIDGTIRENITLGVSEEDFSQEDFDKALHMAELYDFVQALPEKENTRVGEGGSMVSGGQKQRIGIARALYKNPSVLVLDEATSALDNETEKSITNTILKMRGKITIFSIAHRLSTLEQCDFKIELKNGVAHRIENS